MNKYFEELIVRDLISEELKLKYFDILKLRIEENEVKFNRIVVVLLIVLIIYFFINKAVISELNFGPINIKNTASLKIFIPMIFSLIYCRYILLWFELVNQRRTYKILLSQILNLKSDSKLFDLTIPFNITNSIDKYFSIEKLNFLGCFILLLVFPAFIFIALSPIAFQCYMIYDLFLSNDLDSYLDYFIIIIPITILFFSILITILFMKRYKPAYNTTLAK